MNDYLKPENGKNENTGTLFVSYAIIIFSWTIGAFLFALIPFTLFHLNPTPWQLALTQLSQFIPIFAALLIVSIYLKRRFLTFITSRPNFSWRNFAIGVGTWGGLLVFGSILGYILDPKSLKYTFDAKTFFPALIVLLVLVPLQVSSEEIMFRGFVPQSLSRTKLSPNAVVLFSTLVFALPHLLNPEAQDNLFWAVLAYSSMGFGWLIASKKFGGSEIAIGAHFINNFFGLAIVGYADSVVAPSSIWVGPAAQMQSTAISLWILVGIWLLIIKRFLKIS